MAIGSSFPGFETAESGANDGLACPVPFYRNFLTLSDIVARSARGAAALLRLCLQKLMNHLGKSGRNINEDIGELVKEGLPVPIQQALDVCRVIGNNAVHPGELLLEDSPEIANSLFGLINAIGHDRITHPKELVSTLFGRVYHRGVIMRRASGLEFWTDRIVVG